MNYIDKVDGLKSNGHYSLAVIHNDLVFISGQLSINPDTGEKKFGSIEEETLQALRNLERILEEAGSGKNEVLKTTVYIPDMSLWEQVNSVYSNFFGDHKPARSVVPTKNLHYGFKIEIEAIACIKQPKVI